MKRLFYILTIFILILTLSTGCGKKENTDNKEYLNEPVVKTICSRLYDFSDEESDFVLKYETQFTLYSKGGVVLTGEYKDIFTTSVTENLEPHLEDVKTKFDLEELSYDGFSYNSHIEGNQVITDASMDYSKYDINKLKEEYYVVDKDIVDNYIKLYRWIEIYEDRFDFNCK